MYCSMCMPSTCTGQKKDWIPENWSYIKLWAIMWVLETETQSTEDKVLFFTKVKTLVCN